MRKKEEMTLDVISGIDDDIVEKNLKKRFELWLKKAKPKKNAFLHTLIAAACLCIIITSAILLIPNNMFGGPGFTTDQPNVTQPNVTQPNVTPPAKQVPIYQGMTVSNTKPEIEESELSASKGSADGFYLLSSRDNYLPTVFKARANSVNAGIVLLDNNNGNNGNHNGNDGNNGNGGDKHNNESSSAPSANAGGPYYAMKNEDIYILVHISNPDEFEILSFTLNGVKYSSYMFESGSNLETLILKYNVGDVQGVQQYTIDAIKYVDGDKIKDVQMEGDQTVEVMVNSDDTVIDFNVSFDGWDMIISPEWSEDFTGAKELLTLAVYDGETLVKELAPTDTVISGLPAGKRLMLVATYAYGEETRSVRYIFDTPAQSAGLIITGGVITGIGTCSDSEIYLNSPIGDGAFRNMAQITAVHLGDGVTSIGADAFLGCTNLQSIIIPDSVTSIPANAFNGCTSLQSVTIPDSVTSIGASAFEGCVGLTSITIPDSVTSISANAFNGCTSLKSITIPDSVTSIGELAFDGCTSLTSIIIPDSVTSIGLPAFNGCTSLESMSIPFVGATKDETDNTHFGYIFGASSYSDNDDYVPSSLKTVVITGGTSIGPSAFDGCTSLTSVTIGDSVTSIGSSAFYCCTSLTSVTIPDSVTSIGASAFDGCTSLTSVTIGDSVTSIGSSAFDGCTSLTSVTIPDSVTSIGKSAFKGCASLESITIPDGVTSIGESAFEGCTGLTSITIPDSVTSIGASAFKGCTSIESITIPDSVTSIGASVFYGCANLTSITIPNSVTSIGDNAFSKCTSLKNFEIPASVISLGSSLFSGCTSLENLAVGTLEITGYYSVLKGTHSLNITFLESVTTIKFMAFAKCDSIESITIKGATTIEVGAFAYCSSLKSITIPNSVTSIGASAFESCSSLESINVNENNPKYYSPNNCLIEKESNKLILGCKNSIIPDSVTSIGDCAFAGCSSLESITIPDGVTSIGDYAFRDCTSLTSVNYTGTKAEWRNIRLGSFWKNKPIVIHCTDGDITV